MAEALIETHLDGLTPFRRGKVRDLYEVGDQLLIVATDRISAFDYVLGSGIPDKGAVLNQLSAFWFGLMTDIVPNHVVSTDPQAYPPAARRHAERVARPVDARPPHRTALDRVRGARVSVRLGLEGVSEDRARLRHRAADRTCANRTGCRPRSSRRPRRRRAGTTSTSPRPRPARWSATARIAELRDLSIAVYNRGARHAETRGIIVADTKFEFGVVEVPGGGEQLILIDEVLTPDSSRFWPAAQYRPGGGQPSFDKQFVRDYLEQIGWNKQPPAPALPLDVVGKTRDKYVEAFRQLTGRELE